MKKNKLISTLALSLAAVGLASCFGEPEDEGEFDPTLYTLELKVNLQGSEFQSLDLEYNPMDEEEMDYLVQEYGDKGVTKEDLLKIGTKNQDGKYLFMSQDGFYLKAPMVVGYQMTGWYDGDTRIDGGIDYTCDGKTDYLINMPAKNTVLEARYSPIKYNFRMSYETDGGVISKGMKEWDITQGDLVLETPTMDGKTFKNWKFNGYYFNHAEGLVNVEQGQQLDPKCYKTIENVTKIDKDFLLQLGDVAYGYCSELETDLSAIFETKKSTVTISWPEIEDVSFFISLNHSDLFSEHHWINDAIAAGVEGASNPLTFTCDYNSDVEIYFHVDRDLYNFGGFFVNGSQTAATDNDTYSFKAKDIISIEIKATEKVPS